MSNFSRKAYKVSTRNSVYMVLVHSSESRLKTETQTKVWRLKDGLFFHDDRAMELSVGSMLVGYSGNRRVITSPIVSVDRITVEQLIESTEEKSSESRA